MNLMFYIPGCVHCYDAMTAIADGNVELQGGEKIIPISIYGGDPRVKLVEKKFGNKNPDNWPMPMMVLERKTIERFINNKRITHSHRVIIHGIFTQRHHLVLMNNFLHDHAWR